MLRDVGVSVEATGSVLALLPDNWEQLVFGTACDLFKRCPW